MEPGAHFHGSDLEKIEEIYKIPKNEIISFSSNVNPLGISPLLRQTLMEHIDVISTYPDREYTGLRHSIAQYLQVEPEHIIPGNGSTELISLFIQMIAPKQALILGPTYSEYEREIVLSGGRCRYLRLHSSRDFVADPKEIEEQLPQDIDLLVICNPNNPTGSYLDRTLMREILDHCKSLGIAVLVDETYVEFAPTEARVDSTPLCAYYNNLFVIRGVSKFFSAPGLRLGYAICGNPDWLRTMNQKKNPWTIHSLANLGGEVMFQDEDYIIKTKTLITQERQRITKELSQRSDLHVYPSVSNFILVKLLREDITAGDLFDAAIQEKLMIRDCSDFPFLDSHYFRFCFLLPEENDKLLRVIGRVLS